MSKKIVVPDGMLKAAGASSHGVDPYGYTMYVGLQAALEWLSEHPIVPTEKQERDLDLAWIESKRNVAAPYHQFVYASAFGAVEWQRRMFLVDDEDEPISDILKQVPPSPQQWGNAMPNLIREAFKRGRESRS